MSNYKELESIIVSAYEDGVTLDEAEKLAAKFLAAQLHVSRDLRLADLDARMRKTGLKSVRAGTYLESASKGDKKPTEATLAAMLDSNATVQDLQNSLDNAEVNRDELERYYNVFQQAHVYFRQLSRGKFE